LLRGTEKCSENGWNKQEKSERKCSKEENREENGFASDFVELLMSVSFFTRNKGEEYFPSVRGHFIPY